MLGNIIGGFIVILIGVTLAPTIANSVALAQVNGSGIVGGIGANISGTNATVIGLVTLFYTLGIAATAIGIAALGMKNSGLM